MEVISGKVSTIMNEVFRSAITGTASNIRYSQKTLTQYIDAERLLQYIDLSDVGSIGVSQYNDGPLSVELYLKNECKASRLPHKLARALRIKFAKSKSWDKASIKYTGEVLAESGNPKYRVTVHGAVPSTCTVEYTEVPIPRDEIVLTRKVATIKCGKPKPTGVSKLAADRQVGETEPYWMDTGW